MKAAAAIAVAAAFVSAAALAETPSPPAPATLDQLTARIALYPDPLLAELLPAATFPNQIRDAARWAEQHKNLEGDDLADAMQATPLTWERRVQALLPFPMVLNLMAADIGWTTNLGKAFLSREKDLLEAIQRDRRKAKDFGYLKSNEEIIVRSESAIIAILPASAGDIVVPSYDPAAVLAPPTPGATADLAIRYDTSVSVGGFQPYGWNLGKFEVIGGFFRPWGWGSGGIDWDQHAVIINGAPWPKHG